MAPSSDDFQKILQQILGKTKQMGQDPNQFTSQDPGQGRKKNWLDYAQDIASVAGVFDPTPTVDASNALVSLLRGGFAKTGTERNEHLLNAGLYGAAAAVPYFGDAAKLGSKGTRGGLDALLGLFGGQKDQGQSPFVEPPPVQQNRAGPPPIQPPQPPSGPPGGSPPPPPPQPPGGGPPGSGGGGVFAKGALIGGAFGAMQGTAAEMSPIRHGLGTALAGPGPAAVASDMTRMLGRPATAIADILNPATTPMEKFASTVKATVLTLIELPGALKAWGNTLKESQRHLSEYNGVMAATFMKSDMGDIIRDIKSSGATAGTTALLLDSLSDFKDDLRPYGDLIVNSMNIMVATLLKLGSFGVAVLGELNFMGITVKDILSRLPGVGEATVPTAAFEYMDWIRKLPDTVTKPPKKK